MESSFKDIPRLGETKVKPQFGEVRLTIDGTRRKIFDGKCWQYLCTGDPKCRIQARTRCRFHKFPAKIDKPTQRSTQFKHRAPEYDEMETQPNGNRRVWKGTRWHGLCREEGCRIQARDFCKTHLDQRNSLQNTNEVTNTSETRMPLRSQSLTLNSTSEPKEEQEKAMSTSLLNPNLSPEFETTIKSTPEQHTRRRRRRRRRRSVNSVSRDPPMTRRSQRLNQSLENADIQSTDEIEQTNSKKRKLSSDTTSEEHIVPKRKPCGGDGDERRKYSNRSLTFSLEPASISDIPPQKKSISNDCETSLCLKPNRLHTNSQSIEIPIQTPSPLNFDPSTSAILEQFGTIIKKETIIDEESLICVPPVVSTNPTESPCETLQDFLRAEEIKNKEFKLDCQRIGYRLAKIQDCIGSLSSITT